ncbi:lysoplasmalogenase family protein, partial [Escherichia sp. R-CC3]
PLFFIVIIGLTLLLLLLLAWQAPMFDAISYLVLAGLCASLLGDALTLLPRQRLMYAIGACQASNSRRRRVNGLNTQRCQVGPRYDA